MVYRPPYPFNIDPPTHGIRPSYPWYIGPLLMLCWPPTNGISISLPIVCWPWYPWYYALLLMVCWPLAMVNRPPYIWHIKPPNHDILTTIPMVFWPSYPCYFDTLPIVYQAFSYGILSPYLLVSLQWESSIYKCKNHPRGQYIIWTLTPGSIYHTDRNTIWHRFYYDHRDPQI